MATPIAWLRPLTPEARDALGSDETQIDRLPFRIGRESRLGFKHGALTVMERRKHEHSPNNDLYLVDRGKLLNISREHCEIHAGNSGGFVLIDRGSACGTIVGNHAIGGQDRGGECPLEDGNVIVLGTEQSPYIFKFVANS